MTALADVTTASALKIRPHNSDSVALYFGSINSGAQILQSANGAGNSSYNILLNPYGGSVGIGKTGPADKLDVSGDIRVGTGTTGCVKDADGSVIAGTCSSDERFKENITGADSILEDFSQLRFVTYNWNDLANETYSYGTEATQYGLIADEVETVFSNLVHVDSLGYKTLDYSTLQLFGLKAIQELNLKVEDLASSTVATSTINTLGQNEPTFVGRFFARLTEWFGEATNGIGNFFANRVHTKELCVGDESGSETCLTKNQIDNLLQAVANQSSVSALEEQPTDSSNSGSVNDNTDNSDTATTTDNGTDTATTTNDGTDVAGGVGEDTVSDDGAATETTEEPVVEEVVVEESEPEPAPEPEPAVEESAPIPEPLPVAEEPTPSPEV